MLAMVPPPTRLPQAFSGSLKPTSSLAIHSMTSVSIRVVAFETSLTMLFGFCRATSVDATTDGRWGVG